MWLRAMSYVEDILSVIPAAVLVGALYCIGRFIRLKKGRKPRNSWWNEGVRLLLACYLGALVSLVWLPGNFWTVLWERLRWGGEYAGALHVHWLEGSFTFVPAFHNMWQTAANVLLYIPLGLLLPLVWRRGWQVPAAGLGLSLVTELVQPLVGRSFDTADLIANTAGTLVGWLLFCLLHRLRDWAGRR